MTSVIDDYRSAPIDAKFAELLVLIEKAARNAASVTSADIDAVRAAGWSDEAIYDAVTVCALFNFYTTWVDGSGVPGLEDYKPSGMRLATEGYARE
ncbi:MAG TPA: peroxidase [Thermoanaerobaculia bacterium]|nr:peroxidase [Thermoanaerobaculia bacterium]